MEHIKRVGRTLKHKGSILSFYEDDIMKIGRAHV